MGHGTSKGGRWGGGCDKGGRWNGQSEGGGRKICTPDEGTSLWVGDEHGLRVPDISLISTEKGHGFDHI